MNSKLNNSLIPCLDEIISQHNDFGVKHKPLLILEGKTDTEVYDKMLLKSTIEKEDYEIVIGGCKNKIKNFLDNNLSNEMKYLILLDLDYDDFLNKKLENKNVIYTHFYDMENYLTLIDVVFSTYNDFMGIRTEILHKKDFICKLKNKTYPILLATTYKINYLNKYGCDAKIFSIDIINSKDDRLNENNDLEKRINTVKSIIEKEDIKFDNQLWDKSVNFLNNTIKKLDIDEKIDELDFYIQSYLKGRKIVEVYLEIFKEILPDIMIGRNKKIFTNDLRKNLMESKQSKDLIKLIDKKLNDILTL